MSPRPHRGGPPTLASMLYPHAEPKDQAALEACRKKWEEENGPTDLTRRYTSLWPASQQRHLIEIDPNAWLSGIPGFAQEFLKEKMTNLVSSQAGFSELEAPASVWLKKVVGPLSEPPHQR